MIDHLQLPAGKRGRWGVDTLLAAFAAFVLAACGGGGGTPNPVGSAPPPAPSPAPALAPAAGLTTAACFDLAPAQGKTIDLVTRAYVRDAGGQVTSTSELAELRVTGGNALFEGHTAIETFSTFTPAQGPAYTYKAYSRQTGPAELTDYGGVSELVTAGTNSVSKTVFTPPAVNTLTAVPGETRTVTATWVQTTTLNGVTQPPQTLSDTRTATFRGVESVTIPAGSFNACRFDFLQAAQVQGSLWFLVGHGVELKSVGTGGTTEWELAKLLINGSVPP